MRITTAPVSHQSDVDGRQRRYLISMGVRTVCFIGAVAVGPGPLRWLLVLGAVFLPYIAVVLVNAVRPRAADETFQPVTDHRRQLGRHGLQAAVDLAVDKLLERLRRAHDKRHVLRGRRRTSVAAATADLTRAFAAHHDAEGGVRLPARAWLVTARR